MTCIVVLGFFVSKRRQTSEIKPLPDARILLSTNKDGEAYKLVDDGRVFRVIDPGARWSYVDTIFDPKTIERTYVKDGGNIFRVDPGSGKRYRTQQRFEENFEGLSSGAAGLRMLIGETRKWTELTLQSPQASTVSDYVGLQNRILKGDSDFLDARVEPSREQAHSGAQSLKCVCPPKTGAMVCAKASLSTGIVYFVKGQDLWYRAWYRIDGKTRPLTLVDLESSLVTESPGIRVMLFEGGDLGVELKCLNKPTYRQPTKRKVPFPVDRWVEVVWHLHLDDGPAGRVQLWQDGALLVDSTGPTLPFRTAIYNSLEVGISAHASEDQPAVLYVDDLLLTTKPLH